ncbi:hypothetical protein HanPI659440_Chr15g0597041 [Helianthus annuus]|nr:hypothetical protein HanPI659440_Chr15g0597041 [Helianthus annuus]
MLTLIDWIRKNISSEDSSGSTAGLLHGDFRMDNLGFHPIEGNASGGKRAQDAGEKANGLIQIAWSYIQRENVLSQSSIW